MGRAEVGKPSWPCTRSGREVLLDILKLTSQAVPGVGLGEGGPSQCLSWATFLKMDYCQHWIVCPGALPAEGGCTVLVVASFSLLHFSFLTSYSGGGDRWSVTSKRELKTEVWSPLSVS